MAAAAVEIPFLSSHYSIPETTLTSLTEEPTVDLVKQLLECITAKARESEELKSDKLRLEVELENAVRSSESKVKVLKGSVEKGLTEISNLRTSLQESENTCSSLESEVNTLKSSSSNNTAEFSTLNSRISSLEASNRDTLALLESKSGAYDKLAEELSTQHQKTIELRRQVSTLEQELQTANSAAASTRFREQSIQQELELTKKNNEWFETELKTKSGEYLKYRKEKSARISELQRLNEEANSNVDSLKRNENALKSRLDDVEQKYEDSLATVQQLKEEAIQAAESFRVELDSAGRLAELQRTSAETAKQRVQECQVTLDKTRDDAAGEISRLRAEIETEHSDKEAAERRVAELELNIGQLESDVAAAQNQSMSPAPRGLNGTGITTPLRPGTPVGTFSPRASRTKGGLTLTQMYSEYDKMRTLLASEQKNNKELKSALDDMMQDLETSKPEIDEIRADHKRLEEAVLEMSNLLDAAGKEREEATRESRKWQGQVEGLQREGDILRQQLRDLSSQVKLLVMEVHLAKEGDEDYNREELEKLARNGIDESYVDMNKTGGFISRHLTTFKNVGELQNQNVTLRRMLRDLGDKMEGAEARAKEESHQQDQTELKELRIRVQTYRDEMANLLAQTQSYIKERDTFRSMLTRRNQNPEDSTSIFSQSVPLGGSAPTASIGAAGPSESVDAPDYADLLRKVQAHFDSFRQETATDHSSLKQQVNELSRKNSELQSETSRSSSQLGAAVQRAELLQSNFEMLKRENFELQKRYSTVMENSNKQDLKTQQAAEDLVEARGLLDSLHRETANLKAEKELWKNIEKRLIEDNESLRNERGRLDSLNANLQNILNEREHADAESRRRLQTNVENLESELQTTKRKLNDETEESKRAALRREYEHEQSQKRIDDLVASLSSVREELISTKTTRDHLQSRVDELVVEMRSAEERLQVLQTKPTSTIVAPEAMDTQEEGEESGLSREQELAVEASELKRDLDLAKGELTHAKEQVEDYKAISQATEERLQSLNETNEQYQEDTDRLVEEKSQKIRDLEQRIEEISSELSNTNNELTKLRDVQSESERRLQDQKSTYEAEISRLKDQDERYAAAAQFHQEDLKAQAEIAQRAQQNYENELVKHAEAAKSLQVVRGEANQLKLESVDLKTQADSARTSLAQREESWTEIQERYERELSELRQRREEVLAQNTLLHGQLEGITNQISSLQRDRANIPENDEESGAGSGLEGLQEVIKFLRREKEIVDVQYHLSTQESKRLRQQLDYAQSQLDETRLKLEQQRRAAAESETNTLNHNKLMETLAELNLFRESSVTLRNQVKQAEEAVAEKTSRVDELVQEIEPLRTRIRELENVSETKDGEMKLLQEDRDRWQQRTQNILHKYDRVDPADMEALKEKLSALEKERDEAVSARDTLQAQADTFPELLKKNSEDRVNDLRSKLTEQFKARSKELSSRINGKQAELNAAIQEKDVIQLELNTTKEELNELKTKAVEKSNVPTPIQNGADTQQTPVSQDVSTPAQPTDQANGDQVKALEDKTRRLEAALAEKDAEVEKRIKERVDRMKDTLNNKLAEYKTAHKQELEKLEANHQQKVESLSKPEGFSELTEPQARELVAKNKTIQGIVRNNIRTAINKEKEAMTKDGQAPSGPDPEALKELERKFNEEKQALLADRDQKITSAVELAEKKLLAKISMTESRARNMQIKVEVVQKAATETPQKPVIEVWEVAKVTRAPPQMQKPGQVPSPSPALTPTQAPVPSPAAAPPRPAAAPPGQEPKHPVLPGPAVPTTPIQEKNNQMGMPQQQQQQQPQPQQQQPQGGFAGQGSPAQQTGQGQQQTASPSLPNKPPQGTNHPAVGTGPSTLRALQSGLPVARGGGRGAGRGIPAQQQQNPFGQPNPEQQHQQQPQTASQPQQHQQSPSQQHGQRGGTYNRGRGRGNRGGGQNVQTTNMPQGQGQSSPGGGRGAFSAQARQFIPQGNKRARDDLGDGGEGGNFGKRMRGGGGGAGGQQ